MEYLTEKVKTLSWVWQIRKDSGVTEEELQRFAAKGGTLVKSNDIREIRLAGGFFVKYEKPLSIIARVANCFFPKAKSEFESAMLLESNGIHCVNYCGWGYSGSETIILSKELKDSENAYEMWFGRLAFLPPDSPERNQFLDNLALFLRNFFKKSLYHPDLHPGNLLVRKNGMEFFIVDPYGIKDIPSLSDSKLFKMQRIWGAFRGELSEKEAVSLILKSGIAEDNSSAETLWKSILYAESSEMKRLWEKRKERMRTGKNTKYYTVKETEEGTLLIRKGLAEAPAEDIGALANNFTAKKAPWPEAKRLWLRSLYLQFQRLEHVMPVAWFRRKDGELDTLFWEKQSQLSGADTAKKEDIEYFMARCRAAGITTDPENILFDTKLLKLIITNIDSLKKP